MNQLPGCIHGVQVQYHLPQKWVLSVQGVYVTRSRAIYGIRSPVCGVRVGLEPAGTAVCYSGWRVGFKMASRGAGRGIRGGGRCVATSSRDTELRDEDGTSCARDPPPSMGQLPRETNARQTPHLAVAEMTTMA
ncbi:hypothetical protein BHE74_00000473 [Ensete ventricosum]|nr:hypothetical protein BHE74_00000473 [Ensete ventricosum]